MAKIIVLANLKGGVAKSTSTNHFAHAAQANGLDSCIVDFDPNATLYSQGQRLELGVPVYRGNLEDIVKQLKEEIEHDYIFVDTPPNNGDVITRLCLVADEVIVPISPTGYDLDLLAHTTRLISEVEGIRNTPLLSILITKFRLNLNSAKEALDKLGTNMEKFPVLDNRIRLLDVYSKYQRPTKLDEYEDVLKELELI